MDKPGPHRHEFVNRYGTSRIVFGMDRETDEQSLIAYLQKLTDDRMLAFLLPRLSDEEIQGILSFVGGILKQHLTEEEYHQYFLREG